MANEIWEWTEKENWYLHRLSSIDINDCLADLHARQQATEARLKAVEEKHEDEINAAKKLCKIYFEIAEEHIPEDLIRKKRDEKIQAVEEQRREQEDGKVS